MPESFDHQKDSNPQSVLDATPAAQANSSKAREALRCMADMKAQQEAFSPGSCGIDPLVEMFDRIDTQKGADSEGIDRSELKSYLENVGVKDVLFAGTIRKKAAKSFIEKLDKNGDKKVSQAEIHAMAAQVLPESVFDSNGQVDTELLDKYFQDTDTNNNQLVEQPELQAAILGMLPEGTKNAKTTAWVGSLVGIDALDSVDKDGAISRDELAIMAAEADAVKGKG